MSNPWTVSIEAAPAEAQPLIANLLELYSHDLSDVFPVDIGPDGRFGYARLPLYWSAPDTRLPFLIRCGDRVAGFALVTRGSPASDDPSVFDVAEFFVLRRYRRGGVGRQAAHALWSTLGNRWVVRVSDANRPAVPFWANVVRMYSNGEFTESRLTNDGQSWRVFSFDS
jgi:predicted acetyltransferase